MPCRLVGLEQVFLRLCIRFPLTCCIFTKLWNIRRLLFFKSDWRKTSGHKKKRHSLTNTVRGLKSTEKQINEIRRKKRSERLFKNYWVHIMKMRWYLQYPDNVVCVVAIGLHFVKIWGSSRRRKKTAAIDSTQRLNNNNKKWGDFVTWFSCVNSWSFALAWTRDIGSTGHKLRVVDLVGAVKLWQRI